ncbi:MAG: ABC transporter permease [Kiritimatiellaeota bacterium]|nr:ABC transporter permease [Kiritimatiellota bacterium]
MKTIDTLSTVYASLTRHPIRALLATLGIILGIAAVVAMLAISEGGKQGIMDQIRAQGIDNIIVRSVKPATEKRDGGATSAYMPETYGITVMDVDHIKNTFNNVKAIVPVREMKFDVYDGQIKTDVAVLATTPELFSLIHCRFTDSRGKSLPAPNSNILLPQCVLGADAAEKLFKHQDPLGRTVTINNTPFTVMGVIESVGQGRIGGMYNINNTAYVPFDMATALWGDRTDTKRMGSEAVAYGFLYLHVRDLDELPDTVRRLKTYLSTTHASVDYELQVPFELLKTAERTQRIFTIVMTSIAAIALLVGGIGIMNIMLANIYERTREIGIRRALGAKRRDILTQFLSESIVLTFTGGVLGVLLGIVTAYAVEWIARANGETSITVVITLSSLTVSLAVAVTTGLTFGTYPAWKAANLDPLIALRHE